MEWYYDLTKPLGSALTVEVGLDLRLDSDVNVCLLHRMVFIFTRQNARIDGHHVPGKFPSTESVF